MKTFFSYAVLSIILLFQVQIGFAGAEQDSLRLKRTELITQYIDLISSPRSSRGVERQIFDLQNRIISVDNLLLEDYFDNAIIARENALRDLQIEYERNKELEKKIDELNTAGLVIIIVLIILLIIALAIITFLAMRIKKHKHKLRFINDDKSLIKIQRDNILKLKEELEKVKNTVPSLDNSELEKLNSKIDEHEKKAGEAHIQIIQLKNEKNQLQEKLEQLESKEFSEKSEFEDTSEQNQQIVSELKNQLDQAKKTVDELSEQNSIMGVELQNYIQQERNYQNEIERIGTELNHALQQKEDIQRKLDDTTSKLENSQSSFTDQTPEIDKLKKKIIIYEEQLKAEEKARIDFERQINEILDDYKKYIDNLFSKE